MAPVPARILRPVNLAVESKRTTDSTILETDQYPAGGLPSISETDSADIFVAERARDLLWNDGISLSGADALHVGTALLDGCSEFLTLDGKIRNHKKFSAAIPQLKAQAAFDDSRSLTSLIEKLLNDHLKKKGYLKSR